MDQFLLKQEFLPVAIFEVGQVEFPKVVFRETAQSLCRYPSGAIHHQRARPQ